MSPTASTPAAPTITPATPSATPVTYGLDPSTPRFSVARYQRMIEVGIFTTADRMELLENYLVLKMRHHPPHDGTLDLVKAAVPPRTPPGWMLRVQQSIVLSDSQPEPDFALVRGNPRSYLTRHPAPADIGLIIEVAHSSLLRDQRDKTRIYARAGIAVYWIINVVDGRVEVYTQPSGPIAVPAYSSFQIYQHGDDIPLILDGVTVGSIPADELLP